MNVPTAINPADHVGLAYKFAARYSSPEERREVVQDAFEGIMIAARKFDPSIQPKFSNYAWPWMRACVGRARIVRRTGLHIPDRVDQRLGREGARPVQVSLNGLVADTEGDEFGPWIDRIVDPGPSPEEQAASREQVARLRAAMAELPKRERTVLRMRFILGQSAEQVAETFAVSRQRINQIEIKARKALRTRLEKYR